MNVIHLRKWSRFKDLLHKQAALPPSERAETWFRGQSDARWLLQTTLDCFTPLVNPAQRAAVENDLLADFRQELIGLIPREEAPQELALELLARHHGLPSALLDWTESAYIAAFFAFQGVFTVHAPSVAVWALNMGQMPVTSGVLPIRDRELFWFNPRALSQRGVFLRIQSQTSTTETLLDEALTKMVLPASECTIALRDLEAMNITARNLFRDMEGAARTAITRFYLDEAEHD